MFVGIWVEQGRVEGEEEWGCLPNGRVRYA